jgi:hypothetical protein
MCVGSVDGDGVYLVNGAVVVGEPLTHLVGELLTASAGALGHGDDGRGHRVGRRGDHQDGA